MSQQALKLKDLGNAEFKKGQFKEALRFYKDSISINAHDPVVYSNSAAAHWKLGHYEESLADCDRGLELSPELKIKAKLLLRKGTALRSLRRKAEADECFSQGELIQKELETHQSHNTIISSSITPKEGLVPIPIEKVDALPADFLPLPVPKANSPTSHNNSVPSSRANDKDVTSNLTIPREKLLRFSTLAHLPVELRQSAMKEILKVVPEVFHDYYASRAIEEEFLTFYLQSVIFYLNEGAKNVDLDANILANLKEFSKYPRFGISLLMIDESLVRHVFEGLSVSTQSRTELSTTAKVWGL
ncbi:unnamed protein product [Kuraishia capsulata CBS 1993]|uniref:Uncharacterized protein n=1 Tax=Kuraishia capsulata CBS 1993 TaxID=1382522 RepID=W6MR70_9ASCO|nr:uncharacterized protein KUCA_T00003716001 [Kuraishia capsulata CBS 1993]CDK27737.1 unnamed protein product [Kuraishia capsulata CBS 1993]